LKSGNNELLNFTKTVECALFNLNVQKKIRNKIQDVKLAQIPIRPTLKTIDFFHQKDAEMKKTKRKFEVYQ
jgi:phage tail tube protein FII